MRIKSIYINAFGGLKDYTLDFTDGMQVILGENEAGKTTVTEFIKAMFYGTGKRAAGQVMSIRDKYTPFDGSQAGGRIFFERGGREYCIERQFRKSDATDRVTLTDTAAGKTEPCAPDIGRELFGISVGAFERSVFIGNTPDIAFDPNAQGEINQKLSNAALSGGDDVSCREVLNRIDDARLKLISKSGRTGSQVADMNELSALKEALSESDGLARKKQQILAAMSDTAEKLGTLTKRYNAACEVLSRARDIENAQKLKEYLDTKEELDRLTKKLTLSDGTVADEMFLKKFEFGFSKLDNIKNRIEVAKGELKSLREAAAMTDSTPEQIREKIDLAKKQAEECDAQILSVKQEEDSLKEKITVLKEDLSAAKSAKKPFNPLLMAFGVALLAAAPVLWFTPLNKAVAVITAAAGAILAVFGFIIRPARPEAAQKIQSEIDSLGGELSALSGRIMMLKGEKSNIEAKTESYNIALNFGISGEQKIKEKENYIESETAVFALERQKLLKFFGFAEDTDIESIKI